MAKKSATTRTILEMLDGIIEQHHLLKHPFYRAWTEGSLPQASLQTYAEQYYQHVRSFPENLKILAARSDEKLAKIVEDNVAEELNPAGPHPLLWRQFAHSLGVADAALDSARPLSGIAALPPRRSPVSMLTNHRCPKSARRKSLGSSATTASPIRALSNTSPCTKKPMCAIVPLGAIGLPAKRTPTHSACSVPPNAV